MKPLFYNSPARVVKQLVEAMIFEQLVPAQEHAPNTWIWKGKSRIFKCHGRKSAFGRFRLQSLPVWVRNEKGWTDACLLDLVDELPANHWTKQQLIHELVRTAMFCEWNDHYVEVPDTRVALPYEELESLLVEGHPYHPCFKSRVGFTLDDHGQYGPEGGTSFPVQWVAVRRENVCGQEPDWCELLGEVLFHRLVHEMNKRGVSLASHTPFPVHPWQWENSEKKWPETIPLFIAGSFRATQSVRTLWNADHLRRPHMKLSMNIRQTSSMRTLDPASLCAAPAISTWLYHIQQTDPVLAGTVILREFSALAIEEVKGQLGVLWRESVRAYLTTGEEAVPFNALSLTERNGQLFIQPWLEKYGVKAWVERLVEVAVIPVWHLLAVHGVALEAHAQNMILIHEQGWPVRVALRDFHESVEYVPDFLKDPSLVPDFGAFHESFHQSKPGEAYWMNSVEALRELVMDTLFVFHLSDLSYQLEEKHSYEEEDFWTVISQAIRVHMSQQPEWEKRNRQLGWDQPFIQTESLFSKKLSEHEREWRHLVPNIFYSIERKATHAVY